MTKLVNKLILLCCCLLFYATSFDGIYRVVPVIAVIIISALSGLYDIPALRIGGILLYCGLGVFYPAFLYFSPLIAYDLFMERSRPIGLVILVPAAVHYDVMTWRTDAFLLMLMGIAYLIKFYTLRFETLNRSYIKLQDDTKELAFTLEQKNKQLMDKQDYEVNLATLNERNRIAREIHDSVGHVMSSAILQAGALMATARDEDVRTSLHDLKDTLSGGMDSIRRSVHDLYEESIDLHSQLYALVRDFSFCHLSYEYDVENNPPQKIKYAVIAIAKEALSNIIRHSDATTASLIVREMPGFYQLIISDNGSPKEYSVDKGMGIRNITSRIDNLKGNLNIDNTKGFRLFISIPKDVKT